MNKVYLIMFTETGCEHNGLYDMSSIRASKESANLKIKEIINNSSDSKWKEREDKKGWRNVWGDELDIKEVEVL